MAQKRHHFVPKFLLKRFSSDPGAENPLIYKLDKASGRSSRSSVINETVITHYNTFATITDMPANFAEDALALIERDAVSPIENLVRGISISPRERLSVALFAWMQHQRTPLARQWQVHALEQTRMLTAMVGLSDRDRVRSVFSERGEPKTDDEIDAWVRQTVGDLESGHLKIRATADHEVAGMFLGANDGSVVVASRMSWVGFRASQGAQFVLSDHPVAMYDAGAAAGEPVAWLSSPAVEVTLPLDPSYCLAFIPGPPNYREVIVTAAQVEDVNLRTYAWAHWAIYGQSLSVLQQVRAVAKRNATALRKWSPDRHGWSSSSATRANLSRTAPRCTDRSRKVSDADSARAVRTRPSVVRRCGVAVSHVQAQQASEGGVERVAGGGMAPGAWAIGGPVTGSASVTSGRERP